jgi:hypothetical protein
MDAGHKVRIKHFSFDPSADISQGPVMAYLKKIAYAKTDPGVGDGW